MLLQALVACNGHIFFQCPPARTCFYGGNAGTNSDGPWRRAPCDRAPVTPVVAVVAGDTMCLSLQEFVPHTGYFYINLADTPVGPNDPEPDWVVVLMDDTPQTTDGSTTATQRFSVTIPFGMASPHATIQVKQWSDQFQWYYYACTDIRIVSNVSDVMPISSELCWDQSDGQCLRSDGPSRLRMGILEPITYGTWAIVSVLALTIWSIVVCKHGGAKRAQRGTTAASTSEVQAVPFTERFKADASEFKRSLIAVATTSVVTVFIGVGVLESLKACY